MPSKVMQEFQEALANSPNTPSGVSVESVARGSSEPKAVQELKERRALKQTLEAIRDDLKGRNKALSEKEVLKAFTSVDVTFKDYAQNLSDIEDMIEKFLDPKYEMNKEESRLLQDMLDKDVKFIEAQQEQMANDSKYAEAMQALQKETNVELRKTAYRDDEFSRVREKWEMTQAEVWSKIHGNIKELSTSMVGETAKNAIAGAIPGGLEVRMLMDLVQEGLPQIQQTYGNLKNTVAGVKDGAAGVGGRAKAGLDYLRKRRNGATDVRAQLRTTADAVDDIPTDPTPEEAKDGLQGVKDGLSGVQAAVEAQPNAEAVEAVSDAVDDLKDAVEEVAAKIPESGEIPEAVKEELDDLLQGDIPSHLIAIQSAIEFLTEAVMEGWVDADVAVSQSEARDVVATTAAVTGDLEGFQIEQVKHTKLLESVRNDLIDELEVLMGLDERISRAHERLGQAAAEQAEVSEETLEHDRKLAALDLERNERMDAATIGLMDAQYEVWESEAEDRKDQEEWRRKSLETLEDIEDSNKSQEGFGSIPGGLGPILSGAVVAGLARSKMGKALTKLPGVLQKFLPKGLKEVATKAGGKAVGKVAAKEGAEAAGKAGVKAAGKVVAKEVGEEVLEEVGEKALAKAGGKALAKVGGKTAGKTILKKIPLGIGLIAGLGFGIHKALKGDWKGAGMEVASGAASIIPGVGTAVSLGIDGAIAVGDVKQALQDQEIMQTLGLTEDQWDSLSFKEKKRYRDAWDKANDPMTMDEVEGVAQPDFGGPVDVDSVPTEQELQRQEYQRIENAIREYEESLRSPQTSMNSAQGSTAHPAVASAPPPPRGQALDEIPMVVDSLGLILVNSGKV